MELHLGPVDCVGCHVDAGFCFFWDWQLHVWLPWSQASPHTTWASEGANRKTLAHSKPCLHMHSLCQLGHLRQCMLRGWIFELTCCEPSSRTRSVPTRWRMPLILARTCSCCAAFCAVLRRYRTCSSLLVFQKFKRFTGLSEAGKLLNTVILSFALLLG